MSGLLDAAGTVASVAAAPAKKWIYLTVGGAIIVAFLSIGGYAWTMKSEVQSLNQKNGELVAANTILETNNTTLKDANSTLKSVNETNVATINKLMQEREEAKRILAAVASMQQKSKADTKRINDALAEMNKDPSTDGPLAPVLKSVVTDIQNQRGTK